MFYSNGRAMVAGYSEEYSAMSDEFFAEDAGAEAARRHNAQEAYWAACEESDDWAHNGFGADVEEAAQMEAERNFNTLQAWD
jgi:hypothetical protein